MVNYLKFGIVQERVGFKKRLGESAEVFGKWLEILGKLSKIMLYIVRILGVGFSMQPCDILYLGCAFINNFEVLRVNYKIIN